MHRPAIELHRLAIELHLQNLVYKNTRTCRGTASEIFRENRQFIDAVP
jgi:hypothetical protein